jgi:outer membrane protein assembly factor BamB
VWSKELRQHYGFSLDNGTYLWGPTLSQGFQDIYEGTTLTSHFIAYGKLYACGVAGILYCYDANTGKLLWTYEAVDPYNEYLFGNDWWLGLLFITDGKVYVGSSEHSANQPLPRGAPFICVNATTGDLIWRANGLFRQSTWGGDAIIGDSVIATMDTFDQRVYGIGKGPSATTVEAPMTATTIGDSVVIRGTVTDVSPGVKDSALTLRFPNGVPTVSDESMSDWMLYVYKQFPRPTNATGVEVTLDAYDPNGNFVHLGTATSDTSGFYSYAWTTPPVPGEYRIIATFGGSGAYYASYAETALYVQEAAPATPPPQYPVPADYTLTIIGTGIAIIIVVAIATILILRKRP